MNGLEGVKVLELGEGVSAAYATKLMADLGADVVKAETPDGDWARRRGPFPGDVPDPEKSGLFLYLNTNKRGVVLDLPRGRERLEAAARWADILVHNYPPARMAELGLDPEALSRANPKLVVCSITPFGLTGPYKDYRAEEITMAHGGGWANISPGASQYPDEPPLKAFGHQSDFAAGAAAMIASLGCYYRALETEEGDRIDLSVQECVTSFIEYFFIVYSYMGKVLNRKDPRVLQPWGVFPCRDGDVFIVVAEESQWRGLVELMGSPAWALRDEFNDSVSRVANAEALRAHLAEWMSNWTVDALFRAAQAKRVCLVPVTDMARLEASPELKERGFFVEVDHAKAGRLKQLGAPYLLADKWWKVRKGAPLLGQDNAAVFAEWDGTPASAAPRRNNGAAESRRPLEGVRVVDFTWVWAGPFGAMQLAHLGAEVIKVESGLRLDLGRRLPFYPTGMEPSPDRCAYFNQWHQGKKSVTLNFGRPEAIEIARDIIRTSDVVIDNFAAGVMERLGLGYEDLRKLKPDIVMASICGFGHTGPAANYTGYGPAIAMISGECSLTGYPGSPPQEVGIAYGDPNGGWHAAAAVCAALVARRRTGKGQYIDLSLWEAMSALVPEGWMAYAMNGVQLPRIGNRDTLMAPHNCYPSAGDDEWVTIACTDDREWRALAQEIGRPELADDPRFRNQTARKANEDALDAIVAEWTRARTKWEATETLQRAGIAAFPTMTPKDLDEDPHLRARDFFSRLPHPEVGVRAHLGIPWRTARGPNGVQAPAPLLGAHTEEILRGLDYAPERIRELKEAQILA